MNLNLQKLLTIIIFTLLVNYTTKAQLIESFDDVSILQSNGWVFDNRSDFPTKVFWSQGISSLFPAQSGVASSYIFNSTASGSNLVCNWLIMPAIGNIEQLSFYTRSQGIANEVTRMQIMYSPSGTINTGDCTIFAPARTNKGTPDFGDFQTLLSINDAQTANAYPQDWTQYTVNVNGSGRIAFLYYVETGAPNFNSGTLAIDTITRGVTTPAGSVQTVPSLNTWGFSILLLIMTIMGIIKTKKYTT